MLASLVLLAVLVFRNNQINSGWSNQMLGNGLWLAPNNSNLAGFEVVQLLDGKIISAKLSPDKQQIELEVGVTDPTNATVSAKLPRYIIQANAVVVTSQPDGSNYSAPIADLKYLMNELAVGRGILLEYTLDSTIFDSPRYVQRLVVI